MTLFYDLHCVFEDNNLKQKWKFEMQKNPTYYI